jgi:hypothetical protein
MIAGAAARDVSVMTEMSRQVCCCVFWGFYPQRNATMGSTQATRRAGT